MVSGNVGIGTNVPGALLSTGATSQATISSSGRLILNDNTDSTNAVITATSSSQVTGGLMSLTGSNSAQTAAVGNFIYSSTGSAPGVLINMSNASGTGVGLKITMTGTGPALTTSAGNVGIGSITPVAKVDIAGTSTTTDVIRMQSADGTFWKCKPANTTGAFTCS
jgi:hypothetical protein